VDLEIGREDPDEPGKITSKTVKFKNYIGKNNYAGFRYGVNLKNISRTCDSKNIATKLIVKQNSNELADNGFCTIQKAGSNPTGENYLYDF
jgi:phage minor structural protein